MNNIFSSYETIAQGNLSTEEFVSKLVAVAVKGDHTEISLLNNIYEYNAACKLTKALRKLIKSFKKLSKFSYLHYLSQIQNQQSDIQELVNTRTYSWCAEFYQKELDYLLDKRDEFEYYTVKYNLVEMLMGGERPYRDMIDFRKK